MQPRDPEIVPPPPPIPTYKYYRTSLVEIMDPLTALSLASGGIQLFDFSMKTTREVYSLVNSSKEAPEHHTKLEEFGKANEQLNCNLLELLGTRQNLDEDEVLLKQVVDSLRAKIEALLGILDQMDQSP